MLFFYVGPCIHGFLILRIVCWPSLFYRVVTTYHVVTIATHLSTPRHAPRNLPFVTHYFCSLLLLLPREYEYVCFAFFCLSDCSVRFSSVWYSLKSRFSQVLCLSACVWLESDTAELYHFFCSLPMAVDQSTPGGVAIHNVLPVLWITSRLKRPQNTTDITEKVPTTFCSTTNTGNYS